MPVAQVIVVFQRFVYHGSTPYLNINKGSSIEYSPNPLEIYYGTVLSKDVKHTHYKIPIYNSSLYYHRIDLEIIFHLLLQTPPCTTVSPRVFATDPLVLNPIPQLEVIYPTISDFYYKKKPRSMEEVWLWIESWKWWYLTWK
jgi:hypothetical protein